VANQICFAPVTFIFLFPIGGINCIVLFQVLAGVVLYVAMHALSALEQMQEKCASVVMMK
jgi:hypothetical protein